MGGVLSVRCDYFQRMFDSDVQETTTNEVKVPDFGPDVFRSMLRYLYTDTLPESFDEVSFDLLVAADKYGIKASKQKCESDAPLNLENVVEALNVAEKTGSKKLMNRAKKVFKLNFNELMQLPETEEKLSKSLLMKLLSYFYKEMSKKPKATGAPISIDQYFALGNSSSRFTPSSAALLSHRV